MPISKREGESRDEFISRCIAKEISGGYPEDQAAAICYRYADEEFKSATASVSDNTWSTEAPISVELESYDDYPKAAQENAKTALRFADRYGWKDCGTPVGKQRANQLAKGEPISRDTIARMAAFERHRENSQKELGDGCGRLMWLAWGGDEGIEWAQRKLRQLERESLESNFSKVKKVLFEENFNEEDVLLYKSLGFKILVRSARKIKKKDRKVWNKLKSVGLSEDHLVFGEVEDLNKKYDFEAYFADEDPILSTLQLKGEPADYTKYLASKPVSSIEEGLDFANEWYKSSELKFATLKTVFVYEEIPGIPAVQSSSRPFCSKMMSNKKEYSVEEIQNINNSHLVKMFAKYSGLEPSVLLYRGGFYRNPDTGDITPWCRHQWSAKVRFA